MNTKVILMILDGWGIAPDPNVSAVDKANTPFIDSLYDTFAHATLRTDGEHVGLPEGQMGNSEVGHMNLGAGRIVYQDLAKINNAIQSDTLKDEPELKKAFEYAKKNDKPVHLLGLLSDGGVHSHINHIKELLKAADDQDVSEVYVHGFTDGRDVDPKSGKQFVKDLQEYMNQTTGQIASITGRYYAMDRDNRWERVKLAYGAIAEGKGEQVTSLSEAIQKNYDEGTTDEFIKPIIATESHKPVAIVREGDVVIFFNFRTDRGRELTAMLSQKDMPDHGTKKLDLYYVTMTNYDETFENVHIIYDKENLSQTLGEVLSKAGKTQIRIAETEKYPHVTFFFSGGQEQPFDGESRILRNSPKVATYDLKPEMSAFELRDALLPEIEKESADFICLNFANGDMVGHTGSLEAAIKACETVDVCAKAVVEKALEHGYTTLLIADHGNSETMINPDGSPHTAHTTNPVPLILIDKDRHEIKDGILGDIAPTILKIMNVDQPEIMTQHPLL